MPTIKPNQQLHHVVINNFKIENEIVFNYFDKLPKEERDEKPFRDQRCGIPPFIKVACTSTVFPKTSRTGVASGPKVLYLPMRMLLITPMNRSKRWPGIPHYFCPGQALPSAVRNPVPHLLIAIFK